jgi:hypothetical protein
MRSALSGPSWLPSEFLFFDRHYIFFFTASAAS